MNSNNFHHNPLSAKAKVGLLFMQVVIVCAVLKGAGGYCFAINPQGSYTVKIYDSLIDMEANEAPLQEILKELSGKFGFSLHSPDLAAEFVSCRLKASSLTESMEKILHNWNYALLYQKNDKGQSVPAALWVVNKNPYRATPDRKENLGLAPQDASCLSQVAEEAPLPMDHLKKFKKEDVMAIFSDSEKVLLDMDANVVDESEFGDAKSPPLPEEEEQRAGIRINRLADTSPIKMIGLQEGDVVKDVNGTPVREAADLVRSLSEPPEGHGSFFRIELLRDGHIYPIYIELQ